MKGAIILGTVVGRILQQLLSLAPVLLAALLQLGLIVAAVLAITKELPKALA